MNESPGPYVHMAVIAMLLHKAKDLNIGIEIKARPTMNPDGSTIHTCDDCEIALDQDITAARALLDLNSEKSQ
jgi:hypothetical protein